jgi:hypothetical protein
LRTAMGGREKKKKKSDGGNASVDLDVRTLAKFKNLNAGKTHEKRTQEGRVRSSLQSGLDRRLAWWIDEKKDKKMK